MAYMHWKPDSRERDRIVHASSDRWFRKKGVRASATGVCRRGGSIPTPVRAVMLFAYPVRVFKCSASFGGQSALHFFIQLYPPLEMWKGFPTCDLERGGKRSTFPYTCKLHASAKESGSTTIYVGECLAYSGSHPERLSCHLLS